MPCPGSSQPAERSAGGAFHGAVPTTAARPPLPSHGQNTGFQVVMLRVVLWLVALACPPRLVTLTTRSGPRTEAQFTSCPLQRKVPPQPDSAHIQFDVQRKSSRGTHASVSRLASLLDRAAPVRVFEKGVTSLLFAAVVARSFTEQAAEVGPGPVLVGASPARASFGLGSRTRPSAAAAPRVATPTAAHAGEEARTMQISMITGARGRSETVTERRSSSEPHTPPARPASSRGGPPPRSLF